MTFNELRIGQRFEFVEKTTVGCGIFNGIGIKKDIFVYRMNGTNRVIGNVDAKVIEVIDQNE